MLLAALSLQGGAFSIAATRQADFLVVFNDAPDCARTLEHPTILAFRFELRLKEWTSQHKATSAVMNFQVAVDLVGIPKHAWSRLTAAKLLARPATLTLSTQSPPTAATSLASGFGVG